MRAGERLRPWTSSEERRLREMAGRVPRRQIAWELRRGNEAVRQKAKRMGLSLRCWEPRCSTRCPECGEPRTGLGRSGRCRACELRALLARAERETGEALRMLPPAERAVYEGTQARLGGAPEPRPPRPRVEGMGPYAAAKARDCWLAACEEWEVRSLRRELKARRRRLERMREKIRNQ